MPARGPIKRARKMSMFIYALQYRYEQDPAEIAFMLEHLRPGDCGVDIGAYCGGYTFWMQRAVRRNGRVFAFDPQPECEEHFRGMMRDYNMTHVTFSRVALSSSAGKQTFFVPGNKPAPEAACHRLRRKCDSYSVPTVTLDGFLTRSRVPRVALIKCDVEGHELEVFQGGLGRLKADRPVLLFECEERHLRGKSLASVFTFLEDLGYRGVAFCRGRRVPIARFLARQHRNVYDGFYVNNFGFVPKNPARH
jgi:FkbM family methyltransferase